MNILITGGAAGLGVALTTALAANGNYRIYFTYCQSRSEALDLEGAFPNCTAVHCDFADRESVETLIRKMDDMDLQVLINNAFQGGAKGYFHKLPASSFEQSFLVNVLPVVLITQKALSIFRQARFGKIITILTSYLANRPPLGLSEYTALKAYLASLSKSWAVENASLGITSNCVSPSLMHTRLSSDIDERIVENMIDKHPLKKLLTPEEVAKTVLFLVESSQQINGVNLLVNAAENII